MEATVHAATLRLASSVEAADRVHDVRTSLFLRVRDDDGEGWAECPVSRTPGYEATEADVLRVLDEGMLEEHLGPPLVVDGRKRERGPSTVVSPRPAPHAAATLIDAAVRDRRLRIDGTSLARDLGVADRTIGFAGVVGIDEPDRARERAARLVALGATRVRVKVSPSTGVAAVAAVLDEVTVPVVADANGSFWAGDEHPVLAALRDLPLAWLEQPYAPGLLAHTAALAVLPGCPIGLDESVTSLEVLRDVASLGAATVVCVKPSRFGVMGALDALREARRLGLSAYVGGLFEAGLGRAVLGVLSSVGATLDGDVVAPCTYLEHDPCDLPAPVDGRQPLHRTSGIGPTPDPAALRVRLERRV